MIIEFSGLVGAGKSTLAQETRSVLQEAGITVFSPAEAFEVCFDRSALGQTLAMRVPASWQTSVLCRAHWLWMSVVCPLLFAMRNPGLVLHVFRTAPALKVLPVWHRRIILRLFFRVAGQYEYLRRSLRPGEAVIFEEGLIHRAINLYAWSRKPVDPAMVFADLQRIPASDLALFIHVPIKVGLERAQLRGLPERLKDKRPMEVEQFMANSADILSIAIHTSRGCVREVDNSTTLEQAVASLRYALVNKPGS